jgi:hypothetical protein
MDNDSIVSLREYVDFRFAAIKEKSDVQAESIKTATEILARQLDKRLESMNEFRESLRDQNSTFLRKEEYDTRHGAMEFRISALEISKAELCGKASQSSVNITTALAVFSIFISIVSVMVHYIR